YSLVVNAEQPAVKKILEDAEKAIEIPAASDEEKKDEKVEIKKPDEAVVKAYAEKVPAIKQIIDLALLQSGLLKGEALSRFIKRSAEMLG
ncbi:MAG: hypothetical protein K2J23_00865, partial [Muribaculaceae bacterium]|nr:hypothetical protein [Muribaculaceae bacterium]